MDERTEELAGGNASGPVVRIGETVRKPWAANTPIVHAYVRHLRANGIDAPEPLGRDELGRQVLEFVPGTNAQDVPLDVDALARVGRMVRSIHDASESFDISGVDPHAALFPVEGADLMCHGDVAPWNLILGDREVFIDWDGAAPSTRLWDLAYAAQSFGSLIERVGPDVAASRLRALVDGYGADAILRAALPDAMAERTAAMADLLERSHASGLEPWATMFVEGHGALWREASDYVREHRAVWLTALTAT